MNTPEDLSESPLPRLPSRRADSHKGDFGRALVVGGSRGMSGAIALAGKAALRSGAGLVTLAVPRSVQDVVAAYEPSYMTRGYEESEGQFAAEAAQSIIDLSAHSTVVAVGPGLGRSATLTEFVQRLYRTIRLPMVVDADALVALAADKNALVNPGGARVLTPHPGEFSRLTGAAYAEGSRVADAARLAATDPTGQSIVVLKGHGTIITDGRCFATNTTGNPGMATGGTGDVLTGVITALLCQGLSPLEAARLGAHVHGLAGDLAARKLGQVSLIASDLLEFLPAAFQSLGE